MLTSFFEDVYSAVQSLSLDACLCICWGAFAFIFLLTLVLSLTVEGVRRADKRPYLCIVNLFAAATFAFAVSRQSLSFSVLLSAVFWCVAYLSYGLVVLLSKRKPRLKEGTVLQPEPPADIFTPSVRPARSNVRTEHAISVTEKLLQADLSKGDRQEAERIKSTLAFLKAKPDLTPADNDLLNEKFNPLLKLMAKYD